MSDRPARFFKVLVADAQSPRRQELVDVLAREGYEVREVGDGETAWVMAQEYLPDLVIAWLIMPGLDGFAFTSRIRQHPLLQRSYVFLLSNQEGEEAEERAFASGTDEYLPEPIRLQPLLSRIRGLRKKIGC